MTHQDAIREASVERYILGELSGPPRDQFEEHLFECTECASDLKAGVTFLEVSRTELPALARAQTSAQTRIQTERPTWLAWLLSPALLAPALAACLLVTGYQTAVVIPEAHHQLALANTPGFVNTVTLPAGTSRGDDARQVHATRDGRFAIAFDIPPESGFPAYICTLYSPAGKTVWQGELTADEARNTANVSVPVASTQSGVNRLVVQGKDASGAKSKEIATYQFLLSTD